MDIKELQSKTVDWLRFPLSVGVVFNHSRFSAPGSLPLRMIDYSNMSSMDIGPILSAIFSVFIPCIAVPLFFVVSGYFFFYKVENWNKDVYKKKIKSRVKTLFIPYIIWNTLALISILTLSNVISDREFSSVFSEVIYIIRGYILYVGFTPYLEPLWFIRDLMVLCIASPILYVLIKKLNYYIILVFLVIYLLFYYLGVSPLFTFLGPSLFFFSLGAYLSLANRNMVEEARKLKWISAAFCILSFFLIFYFSGIGNWRYISPLFLIAGVITAFNIASYLYEKGKISINPFLTKSSFFVFAIHGLLLLEGWKKMYIHFIEPMSVAAYIVGYFVVPIMTVLSALLTFYLLRTYLPKVADVLTGNRG